MWTPLLLAAGVPAGHATPFFSGLGNLGGLTSSGCCFREGEAKAVSADGSTVVGWSYAAGGKLPFRWTRDTGIVALAPGNVLAPTEAVGVSADGAVVVGFGTQFGTGGFLWTQGDGVAYLRGVPRGTTSGFATDVAADGSVVVGNYFDPSLQAFRWSVADGLLGLGESTSTATGVSADGNTIVGIGYVADSNEAARENAFRWTPETGLVYLGDLPGGGDRSFAWDVSADGTTVVGGSDGSFGQEAFLWSTTGGMATLGTLPRSLATTALGISADGLTVVGYTQEFNRNTAIYWKEFGMGVLQERLVRDFGLDLTGWHLEVASDVSDDGMVIVGTGRNPAGEFEPWIAVIPEPGTFLLASAGLALIALGARAGLRPSSGCQARAHAGRSARCYLTSWPPGRRSSSRGA